MPRSEAELCDALAVAATEDGWRVYPEVGGWDLLLVWTGERQLARAYLPHGVESIPAGYQVGVEAKLRASCDALWEAFSRGRHLSRPDETAVLVPKAGAAFAALAAHLDLRVMTPERESRWGQVIRIDPRGARTPERRLPLPAVALQGSGGRPSPRTMSTWRVAALRLCIRLRARGYLTGADFAAHRVNRTRWLDARWINRDGSVGRHARYVAGPRLDTDGPEVGYEAERDALAAKDDARAEAAQEGAL